MSENHVNNNLQKNLERIVREKNINISKFEKETGLSSGSLWSIVAGRTKNPSAVLVQNIASALGVTSELLYKDEPYFIELMTAKNLMFFKECTLQIQKIFEELKISPTVFQLIEIITAAYMFNPAANQPDLKMIKWLIKNKIILKL